MRTSKRKANAFVYFLLKRLENVFSSPFFWVELCVGWSQSSSTSTWSHVMTAFEISKTNRERKSFNTVSPSLLMSLAKPAAWLPESCEELLKEDGGRLDTSALSQPSVHQSQSRKTAEEVRG